MKREDADSSKRHGWWTDFFPAFRPVFDAISQKATNSEVRYFVEKLGLKPGTKFLDCPCGIGRIAIPLAKRGVLVTGVDATESYLDELAEKARRLKVRIKLVNEDMRRINFKSEFDAAGNIGTSFGFFENASDNVLVLKKVCQALKPGGKFVLNVGNRDWVMANFQSDGWSEVSGTKILQERRFDYSRSINYSTWHIIGDGRERVYEVPLRMYSYHELLAMMRSVGFADVEGYGSLKDEPISRERRMMYIFGTKPKKR